jgi:hypothetical protein
LIDLTGIAQSSVSAYPPRIDALHPLQRQIADPLRLDIAPPGRVSRELDAIKQKGGTDESTECP